MDPELSVHDHVCHPSVVWHVHVPSVIVAMSSVSVVPSAIHQTPRIGHPALAQGDGSNGI
jgi:hypothetical protein